MTFTTRPTLQGTFGMVSSTHWLAVAVGDGHAGARRQRLRRRGHRRLRPARRRAAPQRARRRGAGHRGHRAGPAARRCCAGRGRRRPARPSRTSGPSGSTWSRVPGRSRRPYPAPSTPGCCCCATTARCTAGRGAGAGDRLRRRRAPAAGPGRRHRGGRPGAVRGALAHLRRALAARRPATRRRGAGHQPGVRATPCAGWSRRDGRPAPTGRPRSRPRVGPGARVSSPRRSTRSAARPFQRLQRPPARRAGHRRRPGRVLGELGGARHPRLARLLGGEDRASGARARCCCSPWPLWTRSTTRRVRPGDRGGCARPGRGAQARLRRPRGLVRRRGRRARRRRCSRRSTPRERAALIGDRASAELRPGRPGRARSRACPPTSGPAPPRRQHPADADDGRADRAVGRGDPGRHLPRGRRRPLGQHDLRDAQRWLAAELPDDSGAGLSAGQQVADVLAGGGAASSLAPGRRPRTTLSPTMVHRDGEPVLACGTPGGDQQDQWQLPFLLRHLVGGQSLQEAIDAPTWHTVSLPGSFYPARHRARCPGGRGPARRGRAGGAAGVRARGAGHRRAGASVGCAR